MKRIFIILSLIAGITFMYSCEKEQENPVLDTTTIEAPQLTAPAEGGNYILLQDNADDTLFTISWNAADYQMPNLLAAQYAIELDKAGNNFASPATIATVDTLIYDVTVTKLNDALGVLGLLPNEAASVELRIRSFIPDVATRLDQVSNVVTFSATPYKFKVRPIYMLGSGTTVGWSNTNALEMENVEAGTYTIVAELTSGANMFIKFISVRGQWAPQWGTTSTPPTDTDGVVTGQLSYRPTESVSDPAAIPVPATGTYRVTADTIGLTYKLEPIADKMYVVGNAVGSGNVVEMEQIVPGKFYTTVQLDGSENMSIQFTDLANNRWGSSKRAVTAKASLVDANTGDAVVMLPAQPGTYRIEVNMATLSYTLQKQ